MVTNVISVNEKVLGGTPVFEGARVPIETLFDHLESGLTIQVFLDDFPTVTNDQVISVLGMAGKVVSSQNFRKLYESAS